MARFTTNGFDYETEAPVPFAPIGPQPAKASRTTKSKLADTYTAEEQARIGITDDNRNDAGIDAPCSRCVGSRYFHCWRNIEGGRCFRCGGTGTEFLPMDKLVRTARRNALARADAELNGAVFAWNAIAAEFATIHADRAELAAKHARVQARRAAYVPGFVGAVGTKVDVVVTVKFTKVIDSQWGSSLLVSALTEDGHLVKTFGSGATLWDLAENGAKLRWTGTVKEHANWDGQDQTVTTRTKLAAI